MGSLETDRVLQVFGCHSFPSENNSSAVEARPLAATHPRPRCQFHSPRPCLYCLSVTPFVHVAAAAHLQRESVPGHYRPRGYDAPGRCTPTPSFSPTGSTPLSVQSGVDPAFVVCVRDRQLRRLAAFVLGFRVESALAGRRNVVEYNGTGTLACRARVRIIRKPLITR
jgi:hypothetical protein